MSSHNNSTGRRINSSSCREKQKTKDGRTPFRVKEEEEAKKEQDNNGVFISNEDLLLSFLFNNKLSDLKQKVLNSIHPQL